jgi:hypothetical protein
MPFGELAPTLLKRTCYTFFIFFMKSLIIYSSLVLSLVTGLSAAPISINSIQGGGASGSTFVNFDSFVLGSSTQSATGVEVDFDGTESRAVSGSVTNKYAAPFLSGNNGVGFGPGGSDQGDGVDTTTYLSAGTGSITFTFDDYQNYLGLLWGSVDDYNTLAFYDGDTLVDSFTGADVTAFANGDQGADGTFYVSFFSDVLFNKVIASSTTNSFEIDNIAFDVRNVPDSGATVALLGLGLMGLALARRKL